MAVVHYPAIVERAGAGYSVFFPDLPGCTSAGATIQEAARNAEEALAGLHRREHRDPVAAAVQRPRQLQRVHHAAARVDRVGQQSDAQRFRHGPAPRPCVA